MSIASLILGLIGCVIVTIIKYDLLLTVKPARDEEQIAWWAVIIFILSTLSIIFGSCGIAKSNRTGAPKALPVAGLIMGIYIAIYALCGIINLAMD